MQTKNFCSIREASVVLGVPEFFLRRLEREGKLPGPKSGVKKLVNIDKARQVLNGDESEVAQNV